MIEVNKKNAIAGYMGFVPSQDDKDDGKGVQIDSHIPGYVGYIPAVRAENIFANTYGKTTENCAKKNYPKGI